MSVYKQLPDGTWAPAPPLPFTPGYDAEIYPDGGWQLYRDGDHLVAAGRNRTRLGRALAIRRALRRDRRSAP